MPSPGTEDPTAATGYDSFAAAYARANESSLHNRYYERPAMVRLAGDVEGHRVLDAGCGSGPLGAALREKGAVVTGFDSSPAMVELARQRLGADADLHVADLGGPLPFDDGTFDDVVASLVLHYLQDWVAPLRELRRVLRSDGRVVLSVPHPSVYLVNYGGSTYFDVTRYSEEFTFDGQDAVLTYWHRPLHAMSDAFTEAGFRIALLSEPPFDADTPRELLPEHLRDRTAFVCFLFVVLEPC
ncbi:class I SAM-dependent methyltransferase [Aquipuribacter hungaricus]|uniref:Class I SAM-dependent methyltransferase n=1 Tax=Aquipuribacter hungaricus TaxID=545624 RepID=A0ABV7WDT3_9MICO